MKSKPVVLSEDFQRAVNHINNDVIYDLPKNASYLMIAETCVDAGRFSMWGYPQVDEELKRLIDEHGYNRLLRAVAKIVSKA
jgi:hypothetical protein